MSSSIAYLDDFEDNNPFAEPVVAAESEIERNQGVLSGLNNPSSSTFISTNDNASAYQTQQVPQQQQQQQQPQQLQTQGQFQNQQAPITTLDKDELRKLLPERFTNKYSIKFDLKEIERNKPENPIIRMNVHVEGLPKFRQSEYKDLRRTYNEIVKFNKYLSISNLEVFVPVIPSSKTSYPLGGEDEKKQLLKNWQEWFDRITSNPIIKRDEEFLYFIENDFGYSVINANRKSSVASGLMRKTLKQFPVPYDPYEELAYYRPAVKSAYLICQKLHDLYKKSTKSEKQLSIHVYDMANKLSVLSEFEPSHPGMKNMWEKLSSVVLHQSDLLLVDSISGMAILGDGLLILINDFYEVKEALTNRYLIMRELIQAEAQTTAKHIHANKIKSKASLDPLKVDEALRSLEYATKIQSSLNLQVKRISGEMIYEKEEFNNFVDAKFRELIKKSVLRKVEHHRKVLNSFEKIRLDVRSVDEKGGLSRLNRENLANLKHNINQSQSSSGDSWTSRTFRSLQKEAEAALKKKPDSDTLDPVMVSAKSAASVLGVATF